MTIRGGSVVDRLNSVQKQLWQRIAAACGSSSKPFLGISEQLGVGSRQCFLLHPGLPNGETLAGWRDLEALGQAGLVSIDRFAVEEAVITVTCTGLRLCCDGSAPAQGFHQRQRSAVAPEGGAALHRLSPVERRGRSSKVIIEG